MVPTSFESMLLHVTKNKEIRNVELTYFTNAMNFLFLGGWDQSREPHDIQLTLLFKLTVHKIHPK